MPPLGSGLAPVVHETVKLYRVALAYPQSRGTCAPLSASRWAASTSNAVTQEYTMVAMSTSFCCAFFSCAAYGAKRNGVNPLARSSGLIDFQEIIVILVAKLVVIWNSHSLSITS